LGYKPNYFKLGDVYYKDFNIELQKKISKPLKFTLFYANFVYNKDVAQGKVNEGMVYANIEVLEFTYKFNDKHALRMELQGLQTKQDMGDWATIVAEYTISPKWFFSTVNQYNYGNPNKESRLLYPIGQIGFIKNSDIARAALSENGQKAAILTMDGTLAVWDVSSGEISSAQVFSGELNSVSIPEIEIQGNRYVSVSSRVGKSFVYDILSGSHIRSEQIEQENQAIAFSSNNSLMYVANSNAGTVNILDYSGSLKDSWQAHQSSDFLRIKVTPDGSRVITLGQEGDHVAAKAWTSNGQLLGQWKVTTGRRSDAFLAVGSDGKSIAAQGNLPGDIAQVWELETLDELISRGCERLENYHQAMLSLPPGLPESCDIPSPQSIPFEASLGRAMELVRVSWPEGAGVDG
jgi:hypothetical protein